jgi:hypothetical protein
MDAIFNGGLSPIFSFVSIEEMNVAQYAVK